MPPRRNIQSPENGKLLSERVHETLFEKVGRAVAKVIHMETKWSEQEMVKRIVKYMWKAANAEDLKIEGYEKLTEELIHSFMHTYHASCQDKEWFFDIDLASPFTTLILEILRSARQSRHVTYDATREKVVEVWAKKIQGFLKEKQLWDATEECFQTSSVRSKVFNSLLKTYDAAFRETRADPRPLSSLDRLEEFVRRWMEESMSRAWSACETGHGPPQIITEAKVIRLWQRILSAPGEATESFCIPKALSMHLGQPPENWAYVVKATKNMFEKWEQEAAAARNKKRKRAGGGGGSEFAVDAASSASWSRENVGSDHKVAKLEREIAEIKQRFDGFEQGATEAKEDSAKMERGSAEVKRGSSEAKEDSAKMERGSAVGNRGSSEAQEDSAKMERRSAVGKRGSAVSKEDSAKMERGSAEGKRGSSEAKEASAKMERGSAVGKRGSSEAQEDSAKMERGSAVGKRGSAVSKEDSPKMERGSAVGKRRSAVSKEDSAKMERGSAKGNRGSAVSKEDSAKMERGSAKGKRGLAEAQEDSAKMERGSVEADAREDANGLESKGEEHIGVVVFDGYEAPFSPQEALPDSAPCVAASSSMPVDLPADEIDVMDALANDNAPLSTMEEAALEPSPALPDSAPHVAASSAMPVDWPADENASLGTMGEVATCHPECAEVQAEQCIGSADDELIQHIAIQDGVRTPGDVYCATCWNKFRDHPDIPVLEGRPFSRA